MIGNPLKGIVTISENHLNPKLAKRRKPMPDDFNLIQEIAKAGGNAAGCCSYREARQFLAMYRAIQAHDEKEEAALIDRLIQPETKSHPYDGRLD